MNASISIINDVHPDLVVIASLIFSGIFATILLSGIRFFHKIA